MMSRSYVLREEKRARCAGGERMRDSSRAVESTLHLSACVERPGMTYLWRTVTGSMHTTLPLIRPLPYASSVRTSKNRTRRLIPSGVWRKLYNAKGATSEVKGIRAGVGGVGRGGLTEMAGGRSRGSGMGGRGRAGRSDGGISVLEVLASSSPFSGNASGGGGIQPFPFCRLVPAGSDIGTLGKWYPLSTWPSVERARGRVENCSSNPEMLGKLSYPEGDGSDPTRSKSVSSVSFDVEASEELRSSPVTGPFGNELWARGLVVGDARNAPGFFGISGG